MSKISAGLAFGCAQQFIGFGELVKVTPAVGGAPLKAEVVYCQKQGNDRFVVGLKFGRSLMLWSILEKVKKQVR